MKDKMLFILASLAALCFNNWLLGLILNHQLLFKAGAVSELSAAGQPHQVIFRCLDIVSGFLFVALGITIIAKYRSLQRANYLAFGAIVLGIANTADALRYLPCSETMDRNCVIPVELSRSHFMIPPHGYSSVAISVCYLLLPIAGLFYARSIRSRNFTIISALLISLAAVYMLASFSEYYITGSFGEKAWGPSQEMQMLLLGTWFIIWARSYEYLPAQPK